MAYLLLGLIIGYILYKEYRDDLEEKKRIEEEESGFDSSYPL